MDNWIEREEREGVEAQRLREENAKRVASLQSRYFDLHAPIRNGPLRFMREMCQRAAAAQGLRVYGKGSSPAGNNIIVHPYEPSGEPFIMFDHRDEVVWFGVKR